MYRINIRSYILLTVIVALGLTSCQSYKHLDEPPQADTTGLVRNSNDTIRDTITIADIPWKDFFTDPKLQGLIQKGIDQNFDLKIAVSRISQAEISLSMSRAANLPALSLGAMVDHTRTSSGSRGTDVLGYYSHINTLGFSASWEIDLWGKLKNQTKIRYASYLNSLEYRNLIQTELIAAIAKSYYSLMTLDEQLRITRETVLLLQKSAETMLALKESGQQNAAAVEQSNALLYNTQLSVLQLESQIRQQENALCALLGNKSGAIERDSISRQTVSRHLAYGIPLQFLARRPDVKQAELLVRSAYAATHVAQSSLYPALTISSASLGLAGSFANLFKPASIAAEIVAGLTQPIFNKKQLRGNLKIVKAQQEEALFNFQSSVLNAGQEVSDILYSYTTALNKDEYRQKQVKSLTNAVDYTQELLTAGEANYTEVLNAQQSLLSAQLNQVNDKLEQLTYSVNLYKALGGGTK